MSARRCFLFVLLFGSIFAGCTGSSRAADYQSKVAYKKGVAVKFPDFALTYLGERRVSSPKFPRGFVYEDFRVEAAGNTQTVSWSAGTGDIGPTFFKVGSKNFALELSRSDKLGRLNEGEVVISRAP